MAQTTKKTNGKKAADAQQTWNQISGVMRIFGNTFEAGKNAITKWSVSVSGKDKDGDYLNFYIKVRFAGKDSVEPDTDGLHTIDVENGFLSVDSWTDKKGNVQQALVMVVTANEVLE